MGQAPSTAVGTTTASSSDISSTCPTLPSAATTTSSVYSYTYTGTTTSYAQATLTEYASTFTTTYPPPSDLSETVAATTTTVYYGPTFTSVIFDVVPAATTVTVPRAAAFTPVKCETAYLGPFDVTTISLESTINTYSYVSTVSIDSVTTSQVPSPTTLPTTTIDSTSTISLQHTTTVTSTRDDPTSTVYAACQGTDNVTPDAPPSKYPYLGQPMPVEGTYSSVVAAIDQVDCCNICQANEQCTTSAWYVRPVLGVYLDTDLVPSACQLFLKNDTSSTCDPTFIGATTDQDYTDVIIYYSNGPCGQYDFTYYYPRIVHS